MNIYPFISSGNKISKGIFTMFTFKQMLTPVWDTDTVYGESFTMYREKNGEISASFLYEPEEIIEVRSANLEILYEEGKDYIIKDGKLYLTENTAIPFMEYEDIFMPEKKHGACFAYPEGWLLFNEGHFFHDRQIAVTYKCKKGSWQGYMPVYEGEKLHRTIKKLTEDKNLKLVLFGDSISAGSNASGKTFANPFQPIWGELFAENIRRAYGANVTFTNPSVGGKDSVWAMDVLDEKVIAENPDLVIIAFGMNGGHTPETFESHIKNMVDRIKAANPETDIILVSTSTPNPLLTDKRAKLWTYQHLYNEVLDKFAGDGIAVANIRDVQKALYTKKRFIDTTGNNVNHPNDFFIRVHAQVLSALLIK